MNAIYAVVSGTVPPGVYRFRTRATAAAICQIVEEADFRCFLLPGQLIRDKASFLQACHQAMAFPAYFGHNWDALDECITDLAWAPARGYVVLYDAVAQFARNQPVQWRIALNVLQSAVDHWHQTTTPMYVLLRGTHGTASGIPVLPRMPTPNAGEGSSDGQP